MIGLKITPRITTHLSLINLNPRKLYLMTQSYVGRMLLVVSGYADAVVDVC